MPDLPMRQVSLLMAASRVISLVITLLLVITLGIYVLRLNLLSDILIMATSILLARLDLSRIEPPTPAITGCLLFILVISGLLVGHALPSPVLFADARAQVGVTQQVVHHFFGVVAGFRIGIRSTQSSGAVLSSVSPAFDGSGPVL